MNKILFTVKVLVFFILIFWHGYIIGEFNAEMWYYIPSLICNFILLCVSFSWVVDTIIQKEYPEYPE